MSETDELRSVAWARDPGTWTLADLTLDGGSTLCGLQIPDEDGLHRVAFGVEARVCERCVERARAFEEDAGDDAD